MSNTITTFGTLAPKLAASGFDPVPIIPGQKRPRPTAWQAGGFAQHADDFKGDYTGILTAGCPAVDVDVSAATLVMQIENIVLDVVGCHATPPPARVGMPPRKLLLFRTEEPFEKLSTSEFELPDDPTIDGKRKHSKVEILANGQQFVAYAIHPTTHKPYDWNGHGEPLTVPRADLVVLDHEQAIEIIRRADELLARHGKRVNKARMSQAPGERKASGKLVADDPDLLRDALAAIPNNEEHFDEWIAMLYAVKGALGDDGLDDFIAWSAKSSKHDDKFARDQWRAAKPTLRGAGSIFWLARQCGWAAPASVTLTDFYAHMPSHQYLFVPTRELWPVASVNGRVPSLTIDGKKIAPAAWLDTNRPIEQMAWHPGEPEIIRDRVLQVSGWTPHDGATVFNLYRAPEPRQGTASKDGPWVKHVEKVYPDDADHIIKWLAHRVQHPGVKCNHALVLGGLQGVGKDTLLEPVKTAVGPWNWADISPTQMLGRFNGWAKAVVVRISEARDLGDLDRFAFYDHSKQIIAAPPDVIRVDEKHLRETYVANVCGVVITSNHLGDGLYLPADDRRHYVAWSPRVRDDFDAGYWTGLYRWFGSGGTGHVGAYLAALDVRDFDPKAPPLKTPAFWAMVATGEAPESGELRDVLEDLKMPGATTMITIIERAEMMQMHGLAEELRDRKGRRSLPHKMERVGYVPVRNPDADDGLFVIAKRRQAVYAKQSLTLADQVRAAKKIV